MERETVTGARDSTPEMIQCQRKFYYKSISRDHDLFSTLTTRTGLKYSLVLHALGWSPFAKRLIVSGD
jgi:hypothetical protein